MSFRNLILKISVITVCAGGAFIGAQSTFAAILDAAPSAAISRPDAIAAKLAEISEPTIAMRPISPIYPTIKYTSTQLAVPTVNKSKKAKLAVRSTHKMPLQLALVADRGV